MPPPEYVWAASMSRLRVSCPGDSYCSKQWKFPSYFRSRRLNMEARSNNMTGKINKIGKRFNSFSPYLHLDISYQPQFIWSVGVCVNTIRDNVLKVALIFSFLSKSSEKVLAREQVWICYMHMTTDTVTGASGCHWSVKKVLVVSSSLWETYGHTF